MLPKASLLMKNVNSEASVLVTVIVSVISTYTSAIRFINPGNCYSIAVLE